MSAFPAPLLASLMRFSQGALDSRSPFAQECTSVDGHVAFSKMSQRLIPNIFFFYCSYIFEPTGCVNESDAEIIFALEVLEKMPFLSFIKSFFKQRRESSFRNVNDLIGNGNVYLFLVNEIGELNNFFPIKATTGCNDSQKQELPNPVFFQFLASWILFPHDSSVVIFPQKKNIWGNGPGGVGGVDSLSKLVQKGRLLLASWDRPLPLTGTDRYF